MGKKPSPKEPDVLGEISDGVIIVLHVMAHLKLVYTGGGYLNRGGEGGCVPHYHR